MSDGTEDGARLANRLREAREYLDFTQADVAAALGLARTTVTEVEQGRRKVTAVELKHFAKLYNRSVDWLLGEAPLAAVPPDNHIHNQIEELSESDREQVARFVEFLATANPRRPAG